MDDAALELLTDELADAGRRPASSSSSRGERIAAVELAIRQHGWGLAATRKIRRAVRSSEMFFLERDGQDDTRALCWYIDEPHKQSSCILVFTTRTRLEHFRALHPEVSGYHPSRIDGRRLLGMGSSEYAFIDAESQTAYNLPLRRDTAANLRRLRALFENVRRSRPEEGYVTDSAGNREFIIMLDERGRLQGYVVTEYAYACISVAEERFRDGEFYSARAFVDEALRKLDPAGDEMPRAWCSMLLASLDRAEREYDTAFSHLVEVVRLCRSAGDLQGEADAMLHIAVSPRMSSRPDLAERWGRTASELFEKCIDQYGGAWVQVALAEIKSSVRDFDGAHMCLATARDLSKGLRRNRPLRGYILAVSASLAMAESRYSLAEQLADRASRLHKADHDSKSAALDHIIMADAILAQEERTDRALAEMLEGLRLWRSEARSTLSERPSEEDPAVRRTHWRALHIAAALGDGTAAVELIEAGRSDGLSRLFAQAPGLDQIAFSLQSDLLFRAMWPQRDDARMAATVPPGSTRGWRQVGSVTDRESAYRRLEAALGEVAAKLCTRSPTVEELRDGIPDDTHILMHEIESGADGMILHCVWVPPKPNPPAVFRPVILDERQRAWIAELSTNGYSAMEQRVGEHWRDELARVLLPAELTSALQEEAPHSRLVILPSAGLWCLPFAALRVGQKSLIELSTVSLLPSLSMMPRPADFKGTGSIGFFDPSLPAASFERAVLSEVFPPLVEPRDINELRAMLGHAREQAILVVAAHGTGAPGLSHSLKIGNERLSAAQLLNCELPPTVIFGACFSARLPLVLGGEPLGLPTVALLRGAAGVVGAILPPHDDSAVALLTETYRAVAESYPLADALRQAQLKRIVEAPGEPVEDWAGLVVVGGLRAHTATEKHSSDRSTH